MNAAGYIFAYGKKIDPIIQSLCTTEKGSNTECYGQKLSLVSKCVKVLSCAIKGSGFLFVDVGVNQGQRFEVEWN